MKQRTYAEIAERSSTIVLNSETRLAQIPTTASPVLDQVIFLHNVLRPRMHDGQLDDTDLIRSRDELRQTMDDQEPPHSLTAFYVLRDGDSLTPGRTPIDAYAVHGMRVVRFVDALGRPAFQQDIVIDVSIWGIRSDLPIALQKSIATGVLESMASRCHSGPRPSTRSIPRVATCVSEYDLPRQVLLRHAGFSCVGPVTADLSAFERADYTLLAFRKM